MFVFETPSKIFNFKHHNFSVWNRLLPSPGTVVWAAATASRLETSICDRRYVICETSLMEHEDEVNLTEHHDSMIILLLNY